MRTRDWLTAAGATAVIVCSTLLVGGAPRWSQAIVAVTAAVAYAAIVRSRRTFARISPLVVLPAIALALTAIQLVPLPHGVLAALDPTGVGLRDDGAQLVGVSPSSTITLDHPGTLRGLAFFLILLATATLCLRQSVSERGRYRLLATVAALCGACAVIGGIHELVGADRLFGLYEPSVRPRVLGPLLNNNHFACLMGIGVTVAIGLIPYQRQPSWLRVVWVITMLACLVAMLETYSRGGGIALALGAFVAIATLIAQRVVAHDTPRRRRASFLTSSLPIGVVAACTVIVVLYAGAGGVAQQLSSTSVAELKLPRSKFAAWPAAMTLVDESPWVGVGRGAMEPAFTRVHPASAFAAYSHLENEYLQAAVDWGIPGALLLGIATAWLLAVAVRRWRDGPLAAGGLGALAVVMLQSNVDFGVELLGIALPITAVAATLAYVPLREAAPRALLVAYGGRALHTLALVGCAWLLVSPSTRYLDEDRVHAPTSLAELRGPIQRHPLDYVNYAKAAEVLLRTNDPRAIQLLNHALQLHPTSPALHLDAARLLIETGHSDQAPVEYAAALLPLDNPRSVLAEVTQKLSPAQAATALPLDAAKLDRITNILHDLGHDDVAIAWLDRFLQLQPRATHACDLLYSLAIARANTALAELAAERCHDYQPDRDVRLAFARVLLAKHDETEILRLLGDVDTWQGRSDEKMEAWFVLCDAQLALAYWDEAKRCLRRLDASGLVPQERSHEIADRLEKIQQAMAAPAATGSASTSR